MKPVGDSSAMATLLALVIVFVPPVIWSHVYFRARGFRFSDNLIWWVAGLQTAAMILLWLGMFRLVSFLVLYVAVVALITIVRANVSEIGPVTSRLTMADGILASLIIGASIVWSATYLDVPKGADALAYHLPMAAQWVQTHSFLAQDSRLWFYPGGYELLTAVFFLPTGNDVFWFIPDLLAWSLLVVSVHRLLVTMGVTGTAAAVFVGALLLSPVLRRTPGTGDNDLFVAALVVSAVEAFLRSLQHNSRHASATGLICLGSLGAAKYNTVPWILLAGLYLAFRRNEAVRRFGMVEASAIAIGALLLLSFPIRNLALTGNPIFPVGIGAAVPWGDMTHLVSMLEPVTPEQIRASALIHHPLGIWLVLARRLVRFAAILPAVCFLALLANTMRPKAVGFRRKDYFVVFAIVLAFLIFVTQPFVVENVPGSTNQLSSGWSLRFALPWLVLLCVFCFSKLPRNYFGITAILLLVSTVALSRLAEFAIVMLLVSCALYAVGHYAQRKIAYAGVLVPIVLMVISSVSRATYSLKAERAYTYGGRTRIATTLLHSECSDIIISSTSLRAWPLIGRTLKHRVVSVGMSLPAEEFKNRTLRYDASVVIVSKENGDPSSPTFDKFPPGTPRFLEVLGPEWSVGYDDGFAIAFVKTARVNACWKAASTSSG